MNTYGTLCLVYVTFGSFFYGYDSGVVTSVLGYPAFIEYFQLDASTIGAFGSTYYAGSIIGALFNWWIPDKFGRKASIQVSCVLCIFAASLQCGAQNYAELLVGRIIGGVASGMILGICPTYASEISPPDIRGLIGGIFSLNINVGYAITEWMGLGLSYVPNDVSWRVLLGLQIVPALAMIIGSWWMPASPRWLIMKGRDGEAHEVLRRMHGKTRNGDETFYLREHHQIKSQLELEGSTSNGIGLIIRDRRYWRRVSIVIVFFSLLMFTGAIPIATFQVILYTTLGLTNKIALVLAGCWGTVNCIFSFAGALCLDRIGRRKAFFYSMAVVIVAQILTTAFWATFERTENIVYGKLAVFAMFIYCASWATFLNAICYSYLPEILPSNIRAAGFAASLASFNAVTIMLVQVTPIAVENIGWRYLVVFIVMSVVYVIYVYYELPETSGKTLEEVAGLFGDTVAETLDEAGKNINANNIVALEVFTAAQETEDIK